MKRADTAGEVLNLDQLAERMNVDRRTIIDDANAGKLPFYKAGARGQWRFYWPAVEKALSERAK